MAWLDNGNEMSSAEKQRRIDGYMDRNPDSAKVRPEEIVAVHLHFSAPGTDFQHVDTLFALVGEFVISHQEIDEEYYKNGYEGDCPRLFPRIVEACPEMAGRAIYGENWTGQRSDCACPDAQFFVRGKHLAAAYQRLREAGYRGLPH